MKILIADDDAAIRTSLGKVLEQAGYEIALASNGLDALQAIHNDEVDLLILDIMMPKFNGFEVCERLREQGNLIPIIMLSAKGDIVDKSMGFKLGVDDFVVKPFDSYELRLRVEAQLRRSAMKDEMDTWRGLKNGMAPEYEKFGDLEIWFDQYKVARSGKAINLTAKEFEVMAFMAANPGRVFSREQILESLWGKEHYKDISSVTVFIRRIREKIEKNPSRPEYILTVHTVGYKFCEVD